MAFTMNGKYFKVWVGVGISVSAASITGFYVAIKNNVRVRLSSGVKRTDLEERTRDRTLELAACRVTTLLLAVLCNKALYPVRIPITFALAPPIARFLTRRKLIKLQD